MQENSPLGRVMALVRDLRVRCPWDRVQTRDTLRPYLVEEVLELDHALAEGEPGPIHEELGDFMLHLAWQLVLAEEAGEITAEELAARVEAKMRRRHPQLFELGPAQPWERLKGRERNAGLLDGLPPTLPPLLAAFRLQERAASVGFDWPDVAGPLLKVREELDEAERALADDDREGLREELGDLLFAVVNLVRKANLQPGAVLEGANRKFRERFGAVERLAAERGVDLHAAGLEVLDRLWDEVKARAGTG